jgi:hypothetical protein
MFSMKGYSHILPKDTIDPMRRKNALTQEGLDNLLQWLSEDRDEAAKRYESIRVSLIKKFAWGRCSEPETLADEVFDIVARKLPALAEGYKGKPELYFYGVARNLIFQQDPPHQKVEIPENFEDERDPVSEAEKIKIIDCQLECLNGLKLAQRTLIIDYYRKGSLQNPEFRKDLAIKYSLEPVKLRVGVHRIRKRLSNCFDKCINNSRSVRA